LVAIALVLALPRVSSASSVVPGTWVEFHDSFGTTGGGEFNVQILGTSDAFDFITFCLEFNETFDMYSPVLVGNVSTAAVSGGVGGGNPDPLSAPTAWLFTQFSMGTLINYAYNGTEAQRTASADSLQLAIWFLEEEVTDPWLDDQAREWVSAAVNSGWTDLNGVGVLNLLRPEGGKLVNAQDQLYMTPEPGSLVLLGTGLLVLVGTSSRTRRKRVKDVRLA
jgi:hypothetical protein